MTVDQLEALPDDGNRCELIEGELFVSRAPGLPHQLVLRNLVVPIANYLRNNRIGTVVPGPGAVFSDYDAVIPDLVFVTNERWNQVVAHERFVGAPDLVIEILSPGKENRERDLRVKRQLYSKCGVAEYWIVDTDNRKVIVFRLQEGTLAECAALGEDNEIASPLLPGFGLKVSAVFEL